MQHLVQNPFMGPFAVALILVVAISLVLLILLVLQSVLLPYGTALIPFACLSPDHPPLHVLHRTLAAGVSWPPLACRSASQ
jgi:hypothetical protein